MPHFVSWTHTGSPVWIADNDELLYLSYARQAYFNRPDHLSDPVVLTEKPAFYPRLQFVPGIALARGLSLGPMAVSLIWCAFAGISIALGWYFLEKFYTKRAWLAVAVSIFLLADAGLVVAHPLLRQALVATGVLLGRTHGILESYPQIHTEWRIITPGLSLAYLLIHIWLLGRARETPQRKRIVLAGLILGVLF